MFSLTLSLSGIIKELITMLVAEFRDGDVLTGLNWAGFAVCVSGIIVHTFFKFRKSKSDEKDGNYIKLEENDESPLLQNEEEDVLFSQ